MDAATASKSDSRKRKGRSEDDDSRVENNQSGIDGGDESDRDLSLEDSLMFKDTMIALRMMRAQFPKIEKVSLQPFILRSQLYSSVKDRTQVDRELEVRFESCLSHLFVVDFREEKEGKSQRRKSLRRERVLRIFKLNTGQDDHAIMFLDDYIALIDHVIKKFESKEEDDAVFDWFKSHVIMSKLEPNIGHQELCVLLSAGGKVKDGHISLLMNAGVLTRQLIDPDMYWFAIPNFGLILKGLSQGRKELLSLLSRRKYKEMMLAALEKKRLRFSPLDMRFHLRDLIGSGQLKTAQTPSGIVVRVSTD